MEFQSENPGTEEQFRQIREAMGQYLEGKG